MTLTDCKWMNYRTWWSRKSWLFITDVEWVVVCAVSSEQQQGATSSRNFTWTQSDHRDVTKYIYSQLYLSIILRYFCITWVFTHSAPTSTRPHLGGEHCTFWELQIFDNISYLLDFTLHQSQINLFYSNYFKTNKTKIFRKMLNIESDNWQGRHISL